VSKLVNVQTVSVAIASASVVMGVIMGVTDLIIRLFSHASSRENMEAIRKSGI
jgi:hypothetical protein